MEQSEREQGLYDRLAAIPEIQGAGFSLTQEGQGVGIMRGAVLRGRWLAGTTGFGWYPAGSEAATRKVRGDEEAVYETLRMVLTSLEVMRRRPRDEAASPLQQQQLPQLRRKA